MSVLFMCCFVLCAAAVMSGAATDGNAVVAVAAHLTEVDAVRPVTVVLGAQTTAAPSETPASTFPPTAVPVETAAPATAPPTPIPTPKPTAKPTPKATPTPAPRPTTAPSSESRDQVEAEIRQAWGGDDNKAIAVADCESGLNTRASSPSGTNLGLWQFTMKTWQDYGGSGDPRDASAATQTSVAWRLYQQQGWSPWPGCAG